MKILVQPDCIILQTEHKLGDGSTVSTAWYYLRVTAGRCKRPSEVLPNLLACEPVDQGGNPEKALDHKVELHVGI
jgi:hypothetical protein